MAVIAETEQELIIRLNEWKDNVENKGVRVHMNKAKVCNVKVISSEECVPRHRLLVMDM